jgi:hypothetical protein
MFFVPDIDGNLVNMEKVMIVNRAEWGSVLAQLDPTGKFSTLFKGEPADTDRYVSRLMETLERYGLRFAAVDRSYVNLEQLMSIRVFDNGAMSTVKGTFPGDGVFTVLFKGPLAACVSMRNELFATMQARNKGAIIKP